MLRVTLSVVLALSCLPARAQATDPSSPPGAAGAAEARHPNPRKATRRKAAQKAAASRAVDADSLLAPSTGASRDRVDGSRQAGDGTGTWSVSPKWSAANGGNSAAYGTRALVNELGTNPAESTGYGGGAEVNFHF